MRINEILTEGRDAPLYHVMGEEKAANVFATDTMLPRTLHDIPGRGQVAGNSFTRNKQFKQTDYDAGAGFVCRLTIDQNRLAQTNKIIPVHGELVYQYRLDKEFRSEYDIDEPSDINKLAQDPANLDRGGNKIPSEMMDEEFVVGGISQLHRYVTGVDIWGDVSDTEDGGKFIIKMYQWAKKFNIPVTVAPVAQPFVDQVLGKKKKTK